MSRPIPEGVDIPETCKMLCVGASGDKCFNCGREDGDFCPEYRQAITERDSEVARLNRDGISRNERYRNSDIEDQAGVEVAADKDALIRELVGAIQTWAAAGEAFEKRDAYDDNPGDDYNVQEFLRLNKVAMDLNESAHERLTSSLTLARTTCPEAFE